MHCRIDYHNEIGHCVGFMQPVDATLRFLICAVGDSIVYPFIDLLYMRQYHFDHHIPGMDLIDSYRDIIEAQYSVTLGFLREPRLGR